MTLPKLTTPTYTITLPSTGKEIKFRPFLVKEEKVLLIAMQESEGTTLFDAVKQIIKNCTFDAVDIDKLTTYDLEYIFLQLRIKSKGNMVTLNFKCENEIDGLENTKVPCNHVNDIEFDLNEAKIDGSLKGEDIIILEEETQTGIKMKAPNFETTKNLQKALQTDDINAIYQAIPQYIDTIFQGETTFDEFEPEEFQEWIEELSDTQFGKIQEFFTKIPKLRAEIPIKCEKCGYEETITVEGLQNFLV